MVFYLKYRPQKIEELDSESVRETLKAILPKNSFHAFLFTGPKGLGKTSSARIVAKFLNCERRKNSELEPCNRCSQCVSITNGSNLDLVEIDAASNRGIDEIRELRERINLSTSGAKFRVYIIDEVHMLTTEAFNALLKTLEEPPAHAVFILCTTEPQKVPATIISRCLHVPFSKATADELTRSFKRIVSEEKLNADKEALSEIALLSDGSFRDGSKILQEISLKAGKKKITKELVDKEYQISNIKYQISKLVQNLEQKDAKSALETVQKVVNDGMDMRSFAEELLAKLHKELLEKVQNGGQTKFSLEELKTLLSFFMEASSQIKYAVLPQLPLELAIVEFCSVATGPVSVLPPASARSATASSNSLRAVGNPSTSPPVANDAKAPRASESGFLRELILKVDSQNKMLAGVLRGVVLKEQNGKKVVFEAKSKFHKEKLDEKGSKSLIEKLASEILKKNVTIEFELKV